MNEYQIPQSLKETYIERRKVDIKSCQQALLNKDYQFLANHGHQIKGNALTYGFTELGKIAEQLEENALERNEFQISAILNQYAEYIQNIKPIE